MKPTIKRPTLNLPGKGEKKPDFISLFDPQLGDNPLEGLEPTADLEADSLAELAALRGKFAVRQQELYDEYRTVSDPEYYLVICFQNREQKEDFLQKAGLMRLGDKFLDGLAVAEALGVEITPINMPRKAAPKMPLALKGLKPIKKGGDS